MADEIINDVWPGGPYLVRNQIATYLVSAIPPIIDALRIQWSLSSLEIPYVEQVDEQEPRAVFADEKNSYIAVSIPTINKFNTADIDDLGAIGYRAEYQCRVYTYLRAGSVTSPVAMSGYRHTHRIRDLTATAVRSAFISKPSLETDNCELRLDTLVESYSAFEGLNGDRWAAALFHGFTLISEEQVVKPILGHANTINVTVARGGNPL